MAFFNWCLMVSCGWSFILCVDMVPVSLQSLKAGPDLSLLNGWRLTIIFSPLLDKEIWMRPLNSVYSCGNLVKHHVTTRLQKHNHPQQYPLCTCDVISFNSHGEFGHLTGAGGKKSFKPRLNDHDSDSVTEAKEKCKTNMWIWPEICLLRIHQKKNEGSKSTQLLNSSLVSFHSLWFD